MGVCITAVIVLFQPSVDLTKMAVRVWVYQLSLSCFSRQYNNGGTGVGITAVIVLFQPSLGIKTMAVWVYV